MFPVITLVHSNRQLISVCNIQCRIYNNGVVFGLVYLFDQASINVSPIQFPIRQIAKMPAASPLPTEMMGSMTEGMLEWRETAG